SAHRVTVDAAEIELTATEFKLLRTLIEREGRVQSRARMLETVWQAHPDIQTRTVDMHVQRLRQKLGKAGDCVQPVRGGAARSRAFVELATRLFVTTSLRVAAAVGSLTIAADRMLGRHLEDEIARGLEREARLVADLLPADSLRWPEFARELGTRVGQRVTLIDAKGTVRGDTEFDRASLDRLENHLLRPE